MKIAIRSFTKDTSYISLYLNLNISYSEANVKHFDYL